MKTTIVIYGSSTGSCQSIAETIASKLGVEAVDVANIDDATIASHENLLLGTSTWGAEQLSKAQNQQVGCPENWLQRRSRRKHLVWKRLVRKMLH